MQTEPKNKAQIYSEIARTLSAYFNCYSDPEKQDWKDRHEERILKLVEENFPSGSGFDTGTKLDFETSYPEKLVFITAFHHMDQNGMYDGWTEHQVIVTASLVHGFLIRITGRNRNDIKDYIREMFSC